MANPLIEIPAGFVGGLVAGIVGYATDLATGAILQAFSLFNPWFILLSVIFTIISFLLGIGEAFAAGASFSIGIIVAGYLLKDFVTIIAGFISVFGLLLGVIGASGNRH